jgi:DNA-binding MarR family transcriptional regulator
MATTSTLTAAALQARLMALIRALGLLESERTPCGQPLSPSAAHALAELSGGAPLTQSQLGSRLRLEKSTISRLVGQLEERGWVERRRAEHDGRVLLLALTDQGRQMADQVASSRAAYFARLCERIPPARQGELSDALEMLVEILHGQA